MFNGYVCVIDNLVGHAAPWNGYRQIMDGEWIIWRGKKQKFVFYHFSHFHCDKNGYKTNYNGEWTPEKDKDWQKKLYDDYYKMMKELL